MQDRGASDGTVMWWVGGHERLNPPLDKLELQTVETCEIRMEPSLRGCDLKDCAGSGSLFTVRLPRQTPESAPALPFVVLILFGPVQSRRERAKRMGLRVFVRGGLCTWCHWKGSVAISWWYYKMAEADHCINPYDCFSKPIFPKTDVCSHRIHFQLN